IALALGGIIAFASLPTLCNYVLYGHDLSIHLARIEGLKAGLLAGQFPVRLDPGILNDHGYPFSIMYGDLLLYPAALLRIVGFSLKNVYLLYVVGVNTATALVCWYCLRKMLSSDRLALVGTALYTLAFYRLTNVYVRASVGEYSAMIFLPLVIYGLWRIYTAPCAGPNPPAGQKPAPWCWLPLAIGFSGLLQTHLLSTEMAGLFTLLFCLFALRRTLRASVFLPLCKAAGACIAWNLWFLVPFVQYMAGGVCNISGKYDAAFLADSASPLFQLLAMFAPGAGVSQSIASGIGGEMPLTVGTVLVAGAALLLPCLADPGVAAAVPDGRLRLHTGGWLLGFGGLALLAASDLFPWYDIFLNCTWLSKLLGKLQFSWRFLSLATVLLAFCSCVAVGLLAKKYPGPARTLALCLVIFTLVPAGFLMYEAGQNNYILHYESLASVDEQALQLGGGEYLPATMNGESRPAWDTYDPVFDPALAVSDYQKTGLAITFTAQNTGDAPATATLPLLCYPGYTALGEGDTPLPITDNQGFISLALPAGYTGAVSVEFTGFWYWHFFDGVSLGAILLTAFLFCGGRKKKPFSAS
ncbi:MAG: hypothetical protein PHO10_10740, partial [Gemmiger sp.]|nr:hypothetical protein [Gemmiger sp.]